MPSDDELVASDQGLKQFALAQAIRTYGILLTDRALKVPRGWNEVLGRIFETADSYLGWIQGPTSLTIKVGEIVDQETNILSENQYQGDGPVQLVDTQQVDLTVVETDSKGVSLQDTLTWTVDNTTVATLTISTDTQTCTVVAGTPGSAVVTVTDGTLSATLAIDVIPGTVTAISITPGTPVDQPAPPAPTPSA